MGAVSSIVDTVGDVVGGAVDVVKDAGSWIDDKVNEEIPGGWVTVGAAATGYGLSTGALGGAGASTTNFLGTQGLGTGVGGMGVGTGSTGFGLGAGSAGFGVNTAAAAGAGGYLSSGAIADTLAGISGLPSSSISSTLGNTVGNVVGNVAQNAVGNLLGSVAGNAPRAAAGVFGANQYANTLADYATNLNQAAQQFGTTLTTNVGNIAAGLPTAASSAGGMMTGAANAGAGSITSAANQAGAALTGVANQQAGQTTALAGQLAPSLQFTPVGMTTRFGSTTTPQYDSEGRLTGFGYTVASDIAAQRDRLLGLSNQALPTTTDIGQATTNYYNELQALQNPQREQQLAALRAQLQTTGRGGLAFGATTGASGNALAATNPELAAYYNALAQQQSQQALTAQDIAQQRLNQQLALSQGLFGQAQTLEGAGQQALTLGTNLGQQVTAGATNAANLQMNAQQAAAAQIISAQLQASGMSAQAANNAAQLQVQSATNAAQLQNAAAINQANLNAEAQRLAVLQQLSAAQTGAGLLSAGAQAQNAAVQQGLIGPANAAGSILQPIGNAVGSSIGNAVGGLLSNIF